MKLYLAVVFSLILTNLYCNCEPMESSLFKNRFKNLTGRPLRKAIESILLENKKKPIPFGRKSQWDLQFGK